MCVCVSLGVYVSTCPAVGACGGQKRVSHLLELEPQAAVS